METPCPGVISGGKAGAQPDAVGLLDQFARKQRCRPEHPAAPLYPPHAWVAQPTNRGQLA
ncbi:MAG: hypothetical protein R3E79_33665 [Caldilineaceae bacterium]